MRTSIPFTLCAAVLALTLGSDRARASTPLAVAVPVHDITIDGDLSDWPTDIDRLPLRNEFAVYGRTDLPGDLSGSTDFSPEMMVGWDKGYLYVGVEIADDELFSFGNGFQRDGLEIYVSSLQPRSHPLQYFIHTRPNASAFSLIQSNDDLAYRYHDGRMVYEWRGRVQDAHRNPVLLREGDMVGFDVVAVDNDGNGASAWVPWGQPVGSKTQNNNKVGRLVIAPEGTPHLAAAAITRVLREYGADEGLTHHVEALVKHQTSLVAHALKLAEHHIKLANQGIEDNVTEEEIERIEEEIERIEEEIERIAESAAQDGDVRDASRSVQRIIGGIVGAAQTGAIAAAEARIAHAPSPPRAPHMAHPPEDDNRVTEQLLGILGACLVIVAIGFAIQTVRRGSGPGDDGDTESSLNDRIEHIESRLTDTQDVMIALSEKLDRIDENERKKDS